MKKTLQTIIALALTSGISHAATVTVANADFSSASSAGGNASVAASWDKTAANITTNIYFLAGAASPPYPDKAAYLNASGDGTVITTISQNLSDFNLGLNASTYNSWSISFDAGYRGTMDPVNMLVALVDLGSDGIYQSTDTVLSSATFTRADAPVPPGESMRPMPNESVNLVFTSASTNDIGLIFQNTNANGVTYQETGIIDNIVITAVPEPSSAALLGLGGLALILRRRK